MCRTDTKLVTQQLAHWFQLLGWPETIHIDGGSQYRGELYTFCEENYIVRELSSPYNPQSNGPAEAAVKNAKQLLTKCKEDHSDFQAALADWRNIPRADKSSPSQLIFGRRLKFKLPMLPSQCETINKLQRRNPNLRLKLKTNLTSDHRSASQADAASPRQPSLMA